MTLTRGRRAIRSMRSEEPEVAIAARAAALRPFIGITVEERRTALLRLLRQERRASRSGHGYDASRHAALRRLMAEMQAAPDRLRGPGATAHNEKAARAAGRPRQLR